MSDGAMGQAWRFGAGMMLGSLFLLLALGASSCGGGSGRSDEPSLEPAGGAETATPGERKSWAGTQPSPEFPEGLTWFNVVEPPTIAGLRGKIVLLDFWTLGCINCQHIIPDLKRLEEEFASSLVVIGVHSGKYSTEQDDESIRESIRRYGLRHPVVNDPDFAVWSRFGARAWPTLVLIDPAGNVVGMHAGEGVYELFAPIFSDLEAEFAGRIDSAPYAVALDARTTSTVLSYPSAVLADEAGNRLFIADAGHNRVLVSDLEGRLVEAIGSGEEGFEDGTREAATFNQPQGLALSADGQTLFVADTRNHAVRAVDLERGTVTTIAGTGERLDRLPGQDARPTEVALASPWGLLLHEGQLYIAMAGTHQIWRMDLERNRIEVFAGTSREGIDDGSRLTAATLAQPSGLATDGQFLYWVDPESSSVRRIALGGEIVETLAGTGLFDWGDMDGGPGEGKIQHAQGITVVDGVAYLADTYNHKIKTLDPATRELRTRAGTGDRGWADGAGPVAEFDEPGGLSAARGKLYVADTNNHLVRIVDPASGETDTLTLSNVGVATGNAGGESVRVSLPEQTVAPGATNLRIVLRTPEAYHLNSLAPSRLALTSSNPAVVALGEDEVAWSTDEVSVEVPVPVMLAEGEATITATGHAYFCATGEEALCLIQALEVTIPVRVSAGAQGGEVVAEYTLRAEE